MSANPQDNEIVINRVYDASIKEVWDAWVDPVKVARWWGPRGFTLTTKSKDVRPGGEWIYTMHGPDGVDYQNNTPYLEVEKYSRLVYDHGANDGRPALFRVTANFSEANGQTTIAMRFALATAEAAREMKKFIKQAGGDATWDRLAEFLSKDKDIFVINRSFCVPIQKMFETWATPEHLSRWLAPTGSEMQFIRADIRTGGSSYYCISNKEGMKMFGKATYKEVVSPHRLVYTQIFCDENEKVSRHPSAPTWPETMLTTVTFAQEGPADTRVTVKWEIYGEASTEERATFNQAKAGMTQGWTGSFDKLESYLSP